MELVQGQQEIGSFAEEIQQGRLGTTVQAHERHAHDWEDSRRCTRLWLKVLEQAAAEAVGEVRALVEPSDDITPTLTGEQIQAQARAYLLAVSPDLLEVGRLMGLRTDQTRDIVRLGPARLLKNLREARG